MSKKVTLVKGTTHWANGTVFRNGEQKTVDPKLFNYLKKHYADKFEFEEEKKQINRKTTAKKTTSKKNDEQVEKDEENKEESGE